MEKLQALLVITWYGTEHARGHKQKAMVLLTFPLDDVYSITGSSSGTVYIGTNSFQWTATITQPLIHKFLCPWNVSGAIEITSANAKSTFDFGDGTCDRKASLTINGNIFEIIW
jgi:hypothetical protein